MACGAARLPASVDDRLIQLHVGDPVHEKAADPVFSLENRHLMASVIELVSRCKPGGTAADDRHFPAAPVLRYSRLHPSVPEGRLNDIELIVVDRDRLAVHPADAGLFAERRADAPGELREIAGLEEP